jgi:hypothetical protein
VDKAVAWIVEIIIGACDTALKHEMKTTSKRPPRAPAEVSAAGVAIANREAARVAHAEAMSNAAQASVQAETAAAYAESRKAVRSIFAKEAHEKHTKIWTKMGEVYDTDKAAFFKEFGELTGSNRKPLPQSLRVNGEEVRRAQSIRNAWKERFHLRDVATGDETARKFRKDIDDKNKERMSTHTHENATYNKRYMLGDTQVALSKAKLGKKVGEDYIENEMLKWGGEKLHMSLTHLFNIMHEAERVAKAWKTTPQSPLHKKGDIGAPLNYRPVTYMSNIYKTYERCIDPRVRGAILMPDAQCGFRKGYGPLVTLTRTKIVMDYCKQHNIDLFVVFIDFKQAFERVWRGGLLERLWEMGVRGKMWRVIKDMLTGTKTFVQTNFGPTDTWDVKMGIIQGSVLSAVLFIIFISHMATDLAHLSPSINGTTIPPQLFADDGTLFAVGEGPAVALIDGCVAWAAKWGMLLNMVKSKAMALREDALPLYRDRKMFELVATVVALGVGVDKRGVYSTAYLNTILTRLVTKVRTLMQAGVRLGALRPDMGLHLYTALAQSIVKYALPLTAPGSRQVRKLGEQQDRFARNYLCLPQSTPPHAAKAELGLVDYDLSSSISKLLLHHRISASSDRFTRKLTSWELGNGSTIDECKRVLHTLMPTAAWPYFINLPYTAAKANLKEAAMIVQTNRWRAQEGTLGHMTAHAFKSKPRWGLEASLQRVPSVALVTYLQVRNGAGVRPEHMHNGKCAKCANHAQSEAHLLWACAGTREARNSFSTRATQETPGAWQALARLQPQEAFHFLMGAGAQVVPAEEWARFQYTAVIFVQDIFGKPDQP